MGFNSGTIVQHNEHGIGVVVRSYPNMTTVKFKGEYAYFEKGLNPDSLNLVAKGENPMDKLYKFHGKYGNRQIDSVFISNEKIINSVDGMKVDFCMGDCNDDTYGTFHSYQIEEIKEVPQEVIQSLKENYGATISGLNPVEHIEDYCMECGELTHQYNGELYKNGTEVVCGQCATEIQRYTWLKIFNCKN